MSRKPVRRLVPAKSASSIIPERRARRSFDKDFKREAVAMLLDGHSGSSVAERLGLTNVNLLYRWKQQQLDQAGPAATSLEARVKQLEVEQQRVERERDILKKALAIFGRNG
jgi:transposase